MYSSGPKCRCEAADLLTQNNLSYWATKTKTKCTPKEGRSNAIIKIQHSSKNLGKQAPLRKVLEFQSVRRKRGDLGKREKATHQEKARKYEDIAQRWSTIPLSAGENNPTLSDKCRRHNRRVCQTARTGTTKKKDKNKNNTKKPNKNWNPNIRVPSVAFFFWPLTKQTSVTSS